MNIEREHIVAELFEGTKNGKFNWSSFSGYDTGWKLEYRDSTFWFFDEIYDLHFVRNSGSLATRYMRLGVGDVTEPLAKLLKNCSGSPSEIEYDFPLIGHVYFDSTSPRSTDEMILYDVLRILRCE